MARIIFYLVVLITSTVFGQSNDSEQVKATVDVFFEGFHKGDTTLIKEKFNRKCQINLKITD